MRDIIKINAPAIPKNNPKKLTPPSSLLLLFEFVALYLSKFYY